MSSMHSLYLLTSRMQSQMKKMDAASTNVANANTNGYKRQEVDFETIVGGRDSRPAGQFVKSRGFRNVYEQGTITQTGNPLDMAIVGNGFFSIQKAPGQITYTRDGQFNITPDGLLVNQQGEPVLDEGGGEIELPTDAQLSVTDDGIITAGGDEVAEIGVFEFPPDAGLIRIGGNQFRLEEGAPPVAAENIRVVSEAIEGSNVDPVMETVRLNEVSQAYQGAAKLKSRVGDVMDRAIRELPRLSGN